MNESRQPAEDGKAQGVDVMNFGSRRGDESSTKMRLMDFLSVSLLMKFDVDSLR